MPDITMCPSKTCSARKECYRNPESGTKPSQFRQAWFLKDPCESTDPMVCNYYWPFQPRYYHDM